VREFIQLLFNVNEIERSRHHDTKIHVDINDIRHVLGRTDLPLNDMICSRIRRSTQIRW